MQFALQRIQENLEQSAKRLMQIEKRYTQEGVYLQHIAEDIRDMAYHLEGLRRNLDAQEQAQ